MKVELGPSLEKLGTDIDSTINTSFIVPLELMNKWERCGLISDFLAQIDNPSIQKDFQISNILSTVINELLENVVKFSADRNKMVTFTFQFSNSVFEFATINSTTTNHAISLEEVMRKLETQNVEALFLEQIHKNHENNLNYSGLGLISIVKDYNAKINITIQPKETTDGEYEIHTKVQINLADLDIL